MLLKEAPGEAMVVREGGLVVTRSDDVDDQAALLKGWDQSYTQLEAGNFEAEVRSAQLTRDCGVFRKMTNKKLHKVFALPASMFGFAVQVGQSGPTVFQGQLTSPGDVLLLPGDQQLELICHGKFDVVAAAFPRAELESLTGASAKFGLAAGILRGARGKEVGRWLLSEFSELSHAKLSVCSTRAAQFHDELLHRCAGALDTQFENDRSSRQLALRIFDEAKAYITDSIGSGYVPAVKEVAAHLRRSTRTLEYSFDQVVGVPPSRYLKCLRLCCARRDLKDDAEASVTTVAVKWGFWHFGRFSAAYREMFGELPSQTRSRRRSVV